jgi:hypothetical protein
VRKRELYHQGRASAGNERGLFAPRADCRFIVIAGIFSVA